MRCDVVTLDRCCATGAPLADEVKIVGALATDVALTDVILCAQSVKKAHSFAMWIYISRRRKLLHKVARRLDIVHHNLPTGR